MKTLVLTLATFLAANVTSAFATLIVDTNTGHGYQIVSGSFTWTAAQADATTLSYTGFGNGYLATLTSHTEVQFIYDNFGGTNGIKNLHIGGFQTLNSGGKSAGWNWVTGEAWSYTNWVNFEPNDLGSVVEQNVENVLQLHHQGQGDMVGWNDIMSSYESGYLVEFSPQRQESDMPHLSAVPEPSTYGLCAAGALLGLVAYRRRKSTR